MSKYNIDQARQLVDEFCMKKFGSHADFLDLTLVPIAYSTVTDEELPAQVYADLEGLRLIYCVDEDVVGEIFYKNPEEFLGVLSNLEFDILIGDAEWAYRNRES